MALFIRQDDNRSELQQRIAAELREKQVAKAKIENTPVDPINDELYLKNMKKTTTLAPVWIVIIIFAIVVMGIFIVSLNQ
jgi:hypothetical protein